MAEQSLIQFKADKELKQRASEICAALGTDLPTVFRMCMKQMEIVNGIPFPIRLSGNSCRKYSDKEVEQEQLAVAGYSL